MTRARPSEALAPGLLAALDEHAIVSVADASGRILHVNHKFCEISGYAREELIGQNHRLLKSGLHGADFYAAMWDAISNGKTWHGEVCNRRKSGELYWVEASITPELDSHGLPCRYVSIRTDISATKLAQQRAERAEERFRRSQTYASLGTWELDLGSRMLYVSGSAARLCGRELDELSLPVRQFLRSLGREDRAALLDEVKRSIRTSRAFEFEHRCNWPDGAAHWLLSRGDTTRDPSGRPLRLLGVAQDITARRQAQAQLALFRQAVESTGEGIALCDAHSGRLSYLNPAALDILGLPASRATGADLMALLPPASHAQFTSAAGAARAGQAAHMELIYRRPDGREVPLRNTLTPVKDAAGTVSHWVHVFGDRSAEIERQQVLHIAIEEARRANRAKAEFMSGMSHELRTPLNAILGFAQVLMLQQDLDPLQADSVDEILQAGKHLLALVDELLDISRIDLGTLRIALKPVNLRELVERAISLAASGEGAQHISISHDIPADTSVLADGLRLRQCLINLISNAVKYNRERGQVRISARLLPSGRVRIEVVDNGVGLAESEIAQVFKPFKRFAPQLDGDGGIGIGLSITQRLIKLMNGAIGVTSERGVGSVFWIELAAAPALPSPSAAPGQAVELDLPVPVPPCARRQVLYVEDRPENLRLVRSMLQLLPEIQVQTALNAAQGLSLARDEPPDLILVDVDLPGLCGSDLLRSLRREPGLADTPVIAISAQTGPHEAEGEGFYDVLGAPLDVQQLLLRVREALALPVGEA